MIVLAHVSKDKMFGVLLDVSSSMRQVYALNKSHDASVQQTHAVFSTVVNIVKRELHRYNRQESIFATVFGLTTITQTETTTCDLIPLLEILREFRRAKDPFGPLVDMAKQRNAQHIMWQMEKWIREYLTEMEAALLWHSLRSDESLISTLLEFKKIVATGKVHNPKAYYSSARKIIFGSFVPKPQPKSVQHVSELFDELLHRQVSAQPCSAEESSRDITTPLVPAMSDINVSSASNDDSLQNQIEKIVEAIAPYIYGEATMCKAMNDALSVFECAQSNDPKLLFILSNGKPCDGKPFSIAKKLRALGVKIVTCFLTSDTVKNPRRLLDTQDSSWGQDDGRAVLFKMSSKMRNIHTPLSLLIDANWQLPLSGESRLFFQANSQDVVNVLYQVVVSQLTMDYDALIDVLEKVHLGIYIDQKNADFVPQMQYKGTCYANAIAAVFHLAMSRIVGREGGIPDFYAIRDRIIHAYGSDGAKTIDVLKDVCSEYRLHFRKVGETGARQAINQRRPVIARFSLSKEQTLKFSTFFKSKTTRKGILTKDILISDSKYILIAFLISLFQLVIASILAKF